MVGGAGTEALPEVDGEGSRHTIDIAGNGAHGCGKDGRNEHTGNTRRHLAHHEEGEDGIRLPHGYIQFGGVSLVERI